MGLLVFMFLGCGGLKHYDLGIPAGKADNFYFYIKAAASDQGYKFREEAQGRVEVMTPSGTLLYRINERTDGVAVVTSVNALTLSESEVKQRNEALKQINDALVTRARSMAEGSRDF